MWRRLPGSIFGLLLGLVVLAGCAGTDGGNVASAGGPDGTAPSSAPTKDQEQQAQEYVECLREHGMEVEDPGPDGRLKLQQKSGDGKGKEAMEACRDLAPQMDKDDPQAKERAEQARQYAACMRENGVDKFPDPDPTSPGIKIDKSLADDPDFEKAQETCRDLLGGMVKQ